MVSEALSRIFFFGYTPRCPLDGAISASEKRLAFLHQPCAYCYERYDSRCREGR